MSITKKMTFRAGTIINDATNFARESGDTEVRTEHVLKILVDIGLNHIVGNTLVYSDDELREFFDAEVMNLDDGDGAASTDADYVSTLPIDDSLTAALKIAKQQASVFGRCGIRVIDVEHLLLGLAKEPDGAAGVFLRDNAAGFDLLRNLMLGQTEEGADVKLEPTEQVSDAITAAELQRV